MKKYFTHFAGSFLLLSINCATVQAQFANQQAASLVLGQPNFKISTAAATQSGMNTPRGVAVDKSGNLYMADAGNNRVMIFKGALSKTNGSNTDSELGQPGFTSSVAHTTQNGMNSPSDVFVGTLGNLYVSDAGNNRILIFKKVTSLVNAGTLINGVNADFVLGETNFTTGTAATTQNGMRTPIHVSTDFSGNLYVSDRLNNRILIFKNVVGLVNSGTLANCANADFVLGIADFTTFSFPSSPSQNNFTPFGNIVDGSGNLYVSDYTFSRVLIFKNIVNSVNAGTLPNGANANFRLEQINSFTYPFGAGSSQQGFAAPYGIGIDPSGNLYVADGANGNNDRVVIFNNIVSHVTDSTLVNDPNANIVLGQSTYSTNTTGTAVDSLNGPAGIALDAAGNLFVADEYNNRVLIFKTTANALPVTLISFAANMPDNSEVQLTWSTASEFNSNHFELMRSVGGAHFTNIASVAAAGNSNTIRDYNYLDNTAKFSFSGVIYYQLKEVDIDGNFKMSSVVSVKPEGNNSGIQIWPNPFNDHIRLSINAVAQQNITVSLISTDGKMVFRQQYQLAQGENQISLLNLGNLPAGVYQLSGFDERKILVNQKVVKQ